MPALSITITAAGRAAIINATNTGTNTVNITEVGLGTGKYIPSDTQTALTNETKRLNTIAGLAVNSDTLHVTVKDESFDSYNVSEFGLYTDTGVLFAVYSDSTDFLQKTSKSTLLMSVDLILSSIDAATLKFGDTSFANPPASESTSGVAKIATQTDTETGTNNTKIITPLRLKQRIDQLLDGVTASLNTFKKIATALNNKLGKTEKSVDSAKLNGSTESIESTANTIVARSSSGDIFARLFRSEFGTQASPPISSAQVMIRNSVTDNYLRPVSRAAFLNYLGAISVPKLSAGTVNYLYNDLIANTGNVWTTRESFLLYGSGSMRVRVYIEIDPVRVNYGRILLNGAQVAYVGNHSQSYPAAVTISWTGNATLTFQSRHQDTVGDETVIRFQASINSTFAALRAKKN